MIPWSCRKTLAYASVTIWIFLIGCGKEDSSPPFVPTGVQTQSGPGKVTVSWDPITVTDTNASVSTTISYKIYMASEAGVSPENFQQLPDGRVIATVGPSRTIPCLTPGKTYHFVVTTIIRKVSGIPGILPLFVGVSESDASPEVSIILPATLVVHSSPTGLEAVAGPRQLVLSWDPPPPTEDVDFYTVYMASTPWTIWADTLPGALRFSIVGATSHTFFELSPGTTFWFAVTATCETESTQTAQVSATAL